MKNSEALLAFILYALGGFGMYKLYYMFPNGSPMNTVLELAAYVYGVGGLPLAFWIVNWIDNR